jgi:plasmid stabilization system protein ParE
MAYKIVFTPSANRDLQNALDWEEDRKKGLGKRCFFDLEERINDISVVPEMGTVRYDNVRCVATNVFQYLIHYRISNRLQQVTILRILHIRQRPIWEE